jgi:hypothetical protein
MATSNIAVTEGSGKNIATNSISEDAATKQLQRVVVNTSAGVEVAPLTDTQIRATALPVSGTVAVTNAGITSIDGKITACNTGAVVVSSGAITETNSAAIKTAVEVIDNAIAGTEMQVDVVGALPAGTALLGKVGIDQATANANEVVVKSGTVTAVTSITNAVAVTNAGITSIDGKVTACNTGAVVVSSGAITETNSGSIKTAVETIDNAISGSEMQVDVVAALPAGTNNIGDVDVLSFASGKTILRAVISGATSGDNTIVAADATKKIKVLSLFLVAATAVTVRFESAAAGTALTGVMSIGATGGFVLPAPADPTNHWFETSANQLLNMELGGAVQVSGAITYYLEA